MVSIAITGHRPERISDPAWVKTALSEVFGRLRPERVYEGMAAGVDLWAAVEAFKLGIPFVACRPWAAHAPRQADQQLYDGALQRAAEVVNVSEATTYEGPWLYHNRNAYMVDHADLLVAVWDGSAKGGTAACVRYARKQGKPVLVIDPVRQTIMDPPPAGDR